jgi:hypothetical protein
VKAHALNNEETYDYLGFNFNEQSSLCAWHIIAYNPTLEALFITPNSWSLDPSSLEGLHPFIKNTYWYYVPIGITVGGTITIGFAGAGFYFFAGAFMLAAFKIGAANTFVLYGLANISASIATLISTPFITYHLMNKQIIFHTEALAPQLFPLEGIIPAKSSMQGIVVLPRETLYEPWLFTLFEAYSDAYTFEFINESNYE